MSIFDQTWKPEFLVERLMEVDEILDLTRRLIAENPEDQSLKLSLRQDKVHREKLVKCLNRSLVEYRQHSVSYIFKEEATGPINLDTFLGGLQSFGTLVAATFKELCGTKIDLQFNTVFAGSFGVLLSTPFDDHLVESDFDRGLSAVFDTIEYVGEEGTDTKELLKKTLKGNRDLIRRFNNFFNGIVKTGGAVEIRWQGVSGQAARSAVVPVDRARKLQNLFAAHAQREPETHVLIGQIKGISLLRNVVDIQHPVPGKRKPRTLPNIPFPPELTKQVKANFDTTVKLTIQVHYDYNEMTGLETPHRSLVDISVLNVML
jgi:hypothetical protein